MHHLRALTSYQKTFILFILSSIAALGIAFFCQYVLHMEPCELCLWERRPWWILLITGTIGLTTPQRYAKWIIYTGILCLLSSVILAIIHSGVEHKWWKSPSAACNTHNLATSLSLEPVKSCDTPTYLFGLPLSMTEQGGIYALMMFIITLPLSRPSHKHITPPPQTK